MKFRIVVAGMDTPNPNTWKAPLRAAARTKRTRSCRSNDVEILVHYGIKVQIHLNQPTLLSIFDELVFCGRYS